MPTFEKVSQLSHFHNKITNIINYMSHVNLWFFFVFFLFLIFFTNKFCCHASNSWCDTWHM